MLVACEPECTHAHHHFHSEGEREEELQLVGLRLRQPRVGGLGWALHGEEDAIREDGGEHGMSQRGGLHGGDAQHAYRAVE